MRPAFPRVPIALALLALAAQPVAAQSVAPPFRALFGTAKPAREQLDLTVSAFGEYGGNVAAVPPMAAGESARVDYRGFLTAIRPGLTYTHRAPHTTFSLHGRGDLRYYPDLHLSSPLGYDGAMLLDTSLGRKRRTRLSVDGTVEYTRFYRLSLLPDTSEVAFQEAAVALDLRDNVLFKRAAYIHQWAAHEEQQLTARSSLVFNQAVRYVDFVEETPCHCNSLRDVRGGGGYRRNLTRSVALRLGYEFREAQYGETGRIFRAHDIDVGFDYRRALSRRTTFSVMTGSSVVQARFGSPQFRAIGGATLRYQASARWAMQGEYRRGIEMLEGTAVPVLSDTASAGVVGYLGRRVEVVGTADYSFGNLGFADDRYEHMQGSMRVRMALSRWVAMDGQYFYYHHNLDNPLYFPEFYPALDRQAVRFNLAVWLPLAR